MKNKNSMLGAVMEKIEAQAAAKEEFDKLEKRFNQEKYTWVDRNERLRLVALVCSYVFNLASAVGMLYMAKYISSWYTTNLIGQWIIGGIVTLAFEWAKRETSDRFWDDFFRSKKPSAQMFFLNFIVIFGMSLGSAIMGYNQITKDYSPEYQAQQSNERIKELKADKKAIQEEDKIHMANKNKAGETYVRSQRKVEANENRLAKIDETLEKEYAKLDQLNAEGKSNFDGSVTGGIYTILISIILFEFLFEICMRFMSMFDYKKHKELKVALSLANGTRNAERGTPSPIETELLKEDTPSQKGDSHPAATPPKGAIPARGEGPEPDRFKQVVTNQINTLQSELIEVKELVKEQVKRSTANEMERGTRNAERNEPERKMERQAPKKVKQKPKQNGTPKWVKKAQVMQKNGSSYGEIAAKVGKSKTTVYRHLNK